jgi:hypothetical protein
MTPGSIELSATSIVLSGSSISLGSSAASPLVLGDQLLALFNSHTHICTAPGSPTAIPLPLMTPAQLSTVAKTG